MPTISIFFGIVVQMYWCEHPPHGRHCERSEAIQWRPLQPFDHLDCFVASPLAMTAQPDPSPRAMAKQASSGSPTDAGCDSLDREER